MASRNLKQRLAVSLLGEQFADQFLACIASRTALPENISKLLAIDVADKRIAREIANSVDTGATLTKKSKAALQIMLADKKACDELVDLLENTAFDSEAGTGAPAPAEPPALEEGEEYPSEEPTP